MIYIDISVPGNSRKYQFDGLIFLWSLVQVQHGLPTNSTIAALGSPSGDVASALAAWREIKLAANAAVVGHGGTVTHNHAVGRDHRSGFEIEVSVLFRQMLAAAKAVVDPALVPADVMTGFRVGDANW